MPIVAATVNLPRHSFMQRPGAVEWSGALPVLDAGTRSATCPFGPYRSLYLTNADHAWSDLRTVVLPADGALLQITLSIWFQITAYQCDRFPMASMAVLPLPSSI
jgi:hypothetical protein